MTSQRRHVAIMLICVGLLSIMLRARGADHTSEYLELRRIIGRELFTDAIERCRLLIAKHPDELNLYETLPEVAQYAGLLPAATKFFEERIADGTGIQYAYYGLGTTYYYRKDYRSAVLAFKRAIDLGLNTPECYRNYEYAFERLEGVEAAVRHFNSLSHRYPENANYWYALALAYWEKQDFRKVLQHSEQAILRNPKEPRYIEANAVAMMYSGDNEKASSVLSDLLNEAERIGDVQDTQLLRSYLVLINVQKSNWSSVNMTVQEILKDAREFGFFRWIGWGYKRLADVEFFAGNYEEALQSAEKALSASEWCKDDDLILAILVLQFHANAELGNIEGALDCCTKRLKGSQGKGQDRDYAYALSDIAWTYEKLGAHRAALDYAIEALTRAQGSDAQSLVIINIHTTLGLIYEGLGNYRAALNHFKLALALIPRDSFWARYLSISHASLGMLYLRRGETHKSIFHLQQQLSIATNAGFNRERAYALADLGHFYLSTHQYQRAKRYFEEGLRISNSLEQKPTILLCMRGLATVAESCGKVEEALYWHRSAITMGESMGILQRRVLSGRNVNIELEADYRNVVRLLCNSGKRREAFDAAEISRVRSGLDQISLAQRRIADLLSDSCRSRVLRIKSHLESKHIALSTEGENILVDADTERRLNIQGDIEHLDWEYRRMLDSLQRRDSRFYDLIVPSVVSLAKLQSELLADNQAVLQYVVCEGQTEAFLAKHDTLVHFSIKRDRNQLRSLLTKMSPILDEDLNGDNVLRSVLGDFDVLGSWEAYRLLIRPIEGELHDVCRLVIVADGPLKGLPFEALVTDSAIGRNSTSFSAVHFLVERFELSYVPSLSYLDPQFRHLKRATKLMLAVGNPSVNSSTKDFFEDAGSYLGRLTESTSLPTLPGAEREVQKIKSLFGDQADILTGGDATKARFKLLAPRYRIVHIAAHARFVDERPMYSCIYLTSGDGPRDESPLRAFELFNMDLNAEMAVLSACNTGPSRGTIGMEGLVRGLVFAGVRSIVSSLWSVEDESTARLMERFYRHIRNGERKSRALQLAKLEMIREGKADPFLWAGFVLIGDDSRIDVVDRQGSTGWSFAGLLCVGCWVLLIITYRFMRNRASLSDP